MILVTRFDVATEFVKRTIAPILTTIIMYNLFIGFIAVGEPINYMYLLMFCGIPFGIRFMFMLPIFIKAPGLAIFAMCFNITIGAFIGGFILIWKLIVAVYYLPLSIIKFIRA